MNPEPTPVQNCVVSRHIKADVPCVACGYNLRTLAIEGVCPECGNPVADSFFAVDSLDEARSFRELRHNILLLAWCPPYMLLSLALALTVAFMEIKLAGLIPLDVAFAGIAGFAGWTMAFLYGTSRLVPCPPWAGGMLLVIGLGTALLIWCGFGLLAVVFLVLAILVVTPLVIAELAQALARKVRRRSPRTLLATIRFTTRLLLFGSFLILAGIWLDEWTGGRLQTDRFLSQPTVGIILAGVAIGCLATSHACLSVLLFRTARGIRQIFEMRADRLSEST